MLYTRACLATRWKSLVFPMPHRWSNGKHLWKEHRTIMGNPTGEPWCSPQTYSLVSTFQSCDPWQMMLVPLVHLPHPPSRVVHDHHASIIGSLWRTHGVSCEVLNMDCTQVFLVFLFLSLSLNQEFCHIAQEGTKIVILLPQSLQCQHDQLPFRVVFFF